MLTVPLANWWSWPPIIASTFVTTLAKSAVSPLISPVVLFWVAPKWDNTTTALTPFSSFNSLAYLLTTSAGAKKVKSLTFSGLVLYAVSSVVIPIIPTFNPLLSTIKYGSAKSTGFPVAFSTIFAAKNGKFPSFSQFVILSVPQSNSWFPKADAVNPH